MRICADMNGAGLISARVKRLLKNSEKQAPRGLKPARSEKINDLSARLKRLLKKSKPQIPHRLKSVRDDKYKRLTTAYLKVRPFKCGRERVFQQPLKSCPDTNHELIQIFSSQ